MKNNIENIYNILLNEIVSLKKKPGERLKEEELSTRFKVSRTPIRDVLKKLEIDKLVEIKSQVGTYITKIDLKNINDIIFIRSACETNMLIELTRIITPYDILMLKTLLSSQEKILLERDKNSDDFIIKFHSFDDEFHQRLWSLVGKKTVFEFLNNSYPYFERYRYLTNLREDKEIKELYLIHKKMVEMLEKKDINSLRNISLEHNFSGLNGLKKVQEKYPNYFI